MKKIDIFHLGPQKCATTWVYTCLKEHPQVACPPKDSIHFFDMHYAKGRQWLIDHFQDAQEGQKLFDPTPAYIRSPLAPKRIAAENPEAKLIVCLRHPIERAFSHYWHEKKKQRYNFSFAEALENYDLFASWIETGFYCEHIERYLQYFPRNQFLFQLFEDLATDSRAFLRSLLEFIEVDTDFVPSVIDRKVNEARTVAIATKERQELELRHKLGRWGVWGLVKPLVPIYRRYRSWRRERAFARADQKTLETLEGVPPEVIAQLNQICIPEIERLESLLEINLQHWKKRFAA